MTIDVLARADPAGRPTSIDERERTFTATLSTGAAVPRVDAAGPFIERLDLAGLDPASLRGAPLLDGHQRTRARDVLGRVLDAWLEGDRLMGRIQFSDRSDAEEIWRDVVAGNLRAVSLGYVVERWAASRDGEGRRVRTAVRWRGVEVSLVPLPADAGATIRSNMMDGNEAPDAGQQQQAPAAGAPPAVETRAAANTEIRGIARVAGLDAAWADGQIDAGATIEQARSAAFEALARRAGPAIEVRAQHDAPEIRTRAIADAIAARMLPATQVTEQARPFMARSLVEIARESLERSGIRTGMLSRDAIVQRAMHSTSDFAIALEDAGRRVLMAGYQQAQSPLRELARIVSAQDFRERKAVRMSGIGTLPEVAEHGEITHTTRDEEVETYRVKTFARIFSLTMQSIVNDDLSALSDWASVAGRAAAETEAMLLAALLTANGGNGPTMSDGLPMFDAGHGNITSGAGNSANLVGVIGEARKLMRRQVDLDGTPIRVTPAMVVCSPELETDLERALTEIAASTVEDVNVFGGRLRLGVEPRLADDDWFVVAGPEVAPPFEMAFLSGMNGPQLATREGWDVLGMSFRVVHHVGVGAVDWRGIVKAPVPAPAGN